MRTAWAGAVVAIAALTLTGCSGSTAGTRVSADVAPTVSDTAGFPSTTAPPTPTSGGGASLQAGLLTAADVKGFVPATASTTSSPSPCTPHDPPPISQVTPQQRVTATLESNSTRSAFTENLYRFADGTTAAKFVAVGTKGLSCATATVGTVRVRITGPFTPQITAKTDQNIGWDVMLGSNTYATLSLARVGDTVIALSAEASEAGRTEIVPNTLIQLAVGKYLANR